ncbi:DUF6504 family protein [Nocardioides currus]|uniref:DUF6504 domain-containing protein n=1 Tax=Nocardioides currus TaxID=2133958 RepID=A0A2R7YXG1_9ACTN|nr:DUF6504 family protein [Nocardioides currus]PUA80569.1 hypothetical protein C7S10_12460 [Nocardioides currus]
MRRYDDPVEVRRGETGTFGEGPDQFLWHGRLWKVRSVLAHWVETAPWWQSASEEAAGSDTGEKATEVGSDLLVERELWRVEAGRGISVSGVFDLSFTWSDGRWQLVGCVD